jgi:thiol-disulfide isomerase/thioredoxin
MPVAVAVARILLAAMWIVSSVAKLRDREGFRDGLRGFGLPARSLSPLGHLIPVAELLLAVLLLVAAPWGQIGAVGSVLLLVLFTSTILINLRIGRRPTCHCFGSLGSAERVSGWTVGRNVLLIAVAAFAASHDLDGRSAGQVIVDLDARDTWLVVGAVVLAAAVVALAALVKMLIVRYGDTLLRLEALERTTGMRAASVVPDFTLFDLDHQPGTLSEIVRDGRPALLTFVSPSCHLCEALLPDIATWSADPNHPVSVLVLSDGTVDANRDKVAPFAEMRVLLRDAETTMATFHVRGTPAAVVVNPDLTLATAPAHGLEEIRSMHTALVDAYRRQSPPSTGPRKGDPLPGVVMRDEDGRALELTDLCSSAKVLVFWRSDCGYCQNISAEVRELEMLAEVALVTASPIESVRGMGLSSLIVRDPEAALGRWLGVPGTPSAVAVSEGRLDSPVVVGGPDVVALIRSTLGADAVVG